MLANPPMIRNAAAITTLKRGGEFDCEIGRSFGLAALQWIYQQESRECEAKLSGNAMGGEKTQVPA